MGWRAAVVRHRRRGGAERRRARGRERRKRAVSAVPHRAPASTRPPHWPLGRPLPLNGRAPGSPQSESDTPHLIHFPPRKVRSQRLSPASRQYTRSPREQFQERLLGSVLDVNLPATKKAVGGGGSRPSGTGCRTGSVPLAALLPGGGWWRVGDSPARCTGLRRSHTHSACRSRSSPVPCLQRDCVAGEPCSLCVSCKASAAGCCGNGTRHTRNHLQAPTSTHTHLPARNKLPVTLAQSGVWLHNGI